MKLSSEAQPWLAAAVQRVMAQHHLTEPERAGVYYELMSHLHAAGEQKAREAGRDEVSVADLQAVVLEMGGEDALAQAFVIPRAKPLQRAGVLKRTLAFVVDFIVIALAWWVLAGILFATLVLVLFPFGSDPGRVPRPWDIFDVFGDFPLPSLGGVGLGLFGLYVLAVLGYFVYLEGTYGRTIGKKVFDLRVLRTDGRAPNYQDALVRNLAKVLPPLLFLDVAFMLLAFRKEQQRASDRLAETIVVEVSP